MKIEENKKKKQTWESKANQEYTAKSIILNNKYDIWNHGITLVALVITIIILIILAGISLNFVLGEDSIISTAAYAREQNKIYSIQEKLELEKGDLGVQKEGTLDIKEYLEHIKEKKIVEEKDIAQNHEESYDVTVENKYVFLVEKEVNGDIKIEYLGKAGNITPRIEIIETGSTSNSATIKFKLKYAKRYRVLIKKQEESEYAEREKSEVNNNEVSCLLENLEQGEEYTIKIEAEAEKGAKAEKETEITTITIEGLTIANCTFSYSPDDWTNESVMATAEVKNINIEEKGYTLQTSKNGKDWFDTPSQTFTENGLVYARLVDSTGQEGESITGNVDKIDKIVPSDATITISGDQIQNTLPATLTAEVEHNDNNEGSGVNIKSCKYILNKSNEKLGTNVKSYTGGTFSNNEETITIQPDSATSWYLHVLTVDNAGNTKETIKGPITITENKHVHSGNSTSGGGCYKNPVVHNHNNNCYTTEYCGGWIGRRRNYTLW